MVLLDKCVKFDMLAEVVRQQVPDSGDVNMLPAFDQHGLLPPGDYELTFDQLRDSVLVAGPVPSAPNWDAVWRRRLVDNLEVMVRQLWLVGVRDIFVDGSFAEDKEHPNDIDGYFNCDMRTLVSGALERELNRIDPFKVWTWDPSSRRSFRGSPKAQLPMWHHYRVELYPHFGQLCGIRDKFGNELEFPSAFRLSRRDGRPRGSSRLEERHDSKRERVSRSACSLDGRARATHGA